MKLLFRIFVLLIYVLSTWALYADVQISSSINKDSDASIAYNSVDDEYLVVWTEYSTSSIYVMGQRTKGDGIGNIGPTFTIFSIGAYPSVAYNSQTNEYMVTESLSGTIIGRRVSSNGTLIGSAVNFINKTNSIYSKIIYNPLGNNYLLVAGELTKLANDLSNIKIYARKISADGQPIGTEQLVRDEGHGNYSDGARFSIAYAPITSPETPNGRFLLAISSPTNITMLDDNGVIVSRVWDSQHPGNIVDDHVPFQSSKVGIPFNVDVAFGNLEGEDVFMVVWGDQNNQYNSQPWSGIWAGIVEATTVEYQSESVSTTVFPVSAIANHFITNNDLKSWKPVVSYNKAAYKFMVAWRETPSTDPLNDTKVNHIRANAVSSSIPNYTSNVVLSAISGSENPMNPFIATSTKNTNALVVWDDERNISTKDIDLYGSLFTTTPSKTLILTSPNGGEIWQEGTQQQITWESSDIGSADVKIVYSIDNGASFNFIANQTNTDGNNTYNWTVPNTPSTQCKVQITAIGLSDRSDATFIITEPNLTIVEPNGGESWVVGSTHDIMWNNYYFSDNVKIEYSTDWGSSYSTIVSSTTNKGFYSWIVPNEPSPNCLVRVSDAANGNPSDVSDAIFTIFTPKLTLTSPNGGQYWTVGTKHNITWTSQNIPNNDVSIEYSIGSGFSYNFIDFHTNDQPNESYEWIVPNNLNIPSYYCLVRISVNIQGVEIADTSDTVFSIYPQSGLSIIFPNGGEIWPENSQQEIKWNSTNISDSLYILLRWASYPGSGYYELAKTSNDGSFMWNVHIQQYQKWNELYKTKFWIEILDKSLNYNNGDDYSDSYFSIQQNTSPGDSVNVDLGSGTQITFDSVSREGTTTLNVTKTGTPPPNSFMVFGSSTYYNIETTAEFTGKLKICIYYDDTGLDPYDESVLSLYVNDTTLGHWVDITTSLDIAKNKICGEVSHLSEFAILMPSSDSQVLLVTNTNDSGEGSLRKAIEMANEHIGPDTIKFNISFGETNYDGSKGVWVIEPETNFPSILDSNLVIDGTSQRLFIGEDSNKEGPEIEIKGINLGESGNFLQSFASKTELYELTINNFGSTAIIYSGVNHGIISGCYIGVDYSGMASESNRNGITLAFNALNNHIGPSKYLDKPNVISGNQQDGIYIVDSSSYNTIIGNYIGVNKTATDTIQNKTRGIDVYKMSDNNTIAGNYIGGNYQGIFVYESNNNIIKNNYVGTNENWEYDLGNSDGIVISYNSSKNDISENVVGNNEGKGILISGSNSTQNIISRNSILNNLGFGIDNSEGGNTELAPPVITSIVNNQITGTAGANQVIEVFADSSNEGQMFIDSTLTDASGNFSLTISTLPMLPNITSTARDILGNTSEFSSPFIIITDIEENQIPTEFALYQNYPNPFNPSTTIKYSIPSNVKSEKGNVKLTVYDILGNEVLILVNKHQSAGDYELSFNAKELSSGVYFYQLRTESKTITKKMLLLE